MRSDLSALKISITEKENYTIISVDMIFLNFAFRIFDEFGEINGFDEENVV